ncbi:hypothetical protein Lal_00012134 [Lupinus albus]|nr:hypothetical protein Lal_00012134 [Lupinus albus]
MEAAKVRRRCRGANRGSSPVFLRQWRRRFAVTDKGISFLRDCVIALPVIYLSNARTTLLSDFNLTGTPLSVALILSMANVCDRWKRMTFVSGSPPPQTVVYANFCTNCGVV